MSGFVCLVQKVGHVEGKKPCLSFTVEYWDGQAGAAELALFECDYLGDKKPPESKLEVATIELTLEKGADNGDESKAKLPEWKVSKSTPPRVTTLPDKKTPKGRAEYVPNGKKPRVVKDPTFYVDLGEAGKVAVAVPKFHDEGDSYEIGFTLTQGNTKVQRLDSDQTVGVSITPKDAVRKMLGLAAKGSPGAGQGRFDDPLRNPSVSPEDAPDQLDAKTKAALATASPTNRVDCDGLRFSNFVPAERRLQKVMQLADEVKLAPGDLLEEWHAAKGRDVEKAFFIVHDVGNRFPPGSKDYLSNARFRERTADRMLPGPKGKYKTVNGYINQSGTYCYLYDFEMAEADQPMGGTGYSWYRWNNPYCVGIEMVPVTETNPEGNYVCMGWHKNDGKIDYVKWPEAVVDTAALLYVLCSARAGHLMTVVTHFQHDKGHHTDPWGFDLNLYYDKIAGLLNKLGGMQLPVGAIRFGTERSLMLDDSDKKNGTIPRARSWLPDKDQVFPWQSGFDKDRKKKK